MGSASANAPRDGETASTGGAGAPTLPAGPLERDPDAVLEYLSDFVVFAGREVNAEQAAGSTAEPKRLVLAFDANRGREGKSYAAEHFAVMWVEGRGWVELGATSDVPGSPAHFERLAGAVIPAGPKVRSEGDALRGLQLFIASKELHLVAEPIALTTDRREGANAFATGAAAAQLKLGARTFVGVVHYELCYLAGLNPLAKTYTDLFGDGYHGVYALTGDGRPLRMHRSGGRLESLVQRRCGYLAPTPGASVRELPKFSFDLSKRSLGGFFRWPGRYTSSWQTPLPAATGTGADRAPLDPRPTQTSRLSVDLSERETLINYVFGGVAIAIATGELIEGDSRQPVFGFALIVL